MKSFYASIAILVLFILPLSAATITITSYDIANATKSGAGGWAHSYYGTITTISGDTANYSNGSGTLNDGSMSTSSSNCQYFNLSVGPVITLKLASSATIEKIELYGFNNGNAIPGNMVSASITIQGVTVNYNTEGFGVINSSNGYPINELITLSGSQNALLTNQIQISNMAGVGSHGGYAAIGEIIVYTSNAVPVPEPMSLLCLAFGLIGLGIRQIRK